MTFPSLASTSSTPAAESPAAQARSHGYRIGQIIAGRYRLSQTINQGSMGSVWLGRDLILDLPVAVKLLHHGDDASDADHAYLTDRIMREARATASVRHPAIVRVLDYGITLSAGPYLVTELLEGHALGRRLQRGRIVPERAVQVLLPIADALSAVHTGGFVHRDVKPDNVFLSKDNHGRIQPKLIDFGLAKLPAGTKGLILTGGGVLGTPEYMPPEQIIESSTVDHRADIWGFSIMLYEMLWGDVPFNGRSCPEILRAILDREVPSLTTAMGLDARLWAILERGLKKDPFHRWPDISELGAALADWLSGRGISEDITGTSLRTQWSSRSS